MSHLTEKLMNKILRDGAKLRDPAQIAKENEKRAISSGKLCRKGKCMYAKFCGEYKAPVTCEMFCPPSKRPNMDNRSRYNGRK